MRARQVPRFISPRARGASLATGRCNPSLAKGAIRLYLNPMKTLILMDDRARLRERFFGAAMSVRARLG